MTRSLLLLLIGLFASLLFGGIVVAEETKILMPPSLMEESGDAAAELKLTIAALVETELLSKKEESSLNKLLTGPVAGKLLIIGDARAAAVKKNKPKPGFGKIAGAQQVEFDAILEWGGDAYEELEAVSEQMKNDLDSMSEMGEMESLRLQMAMDRLSKMMSTLSNLLKKSSETKEDITQNMK